MNKLVKGFFLVLLCASCSSLFSSCARSGCGGSWYNNRNVQVDPAIDINTIAATDTAEIEAASQMLTCK